jgi:phytoene desaturase
MAEKAAARGARQVRAAVVGSGFGGLAAAVRLQAAGLETVLFEARDKPGGRAYVYERDGFVFDAGPTVITAPGVFEELFELSGKKLEDYVEFIGVQPFYRLVWDDGDAFDYTGNSEHMLEQIRARNPEDGDGYLQFVDYSRRVFQKGYEELAAKPFLRFWDMLRVAPTLAMLRADRSVYETVARFVDNDHVRQALSFHSLLVGGNPFDTSAIYTLIHYLERNWGVFFPRGGTGALVRALIRLYEQLGGELRLSSAVRQIEVDGSAGRAKHLVSTDATQREPFDLVVSNADVYHTYAQLYRSERSAERTRRWLQRMEWSMSLFVLYFGTDRTYDIAHHTVVFGPRYRGLLDDIFRGNELPEDFSLYLHYPTVTDPSLSPDGCGTFYVLSPVPNLGQAPLDWDDVAEGYADKILAALERHLPDLRKHIVAKLWMTPNDFERELVAYQGAAFSVAPTLTQSAWFRPHNRDPQIPGLYLVGAGTHPGAGLPGVVSSAKASCSIIAEDFGLELSG